VLDEAYQKTYDAYLKHKDVLVPSEGPGGAGHVLVPAAGDGGGGSGGSSLSPTTTNTASEILHHECIFPFPLSNRDYVYYRRRLVDPGSYFTYVQRDVVPKERGLALRPPGKGVVRAGNGLFWQLSMGRAEPDDDGAGGEGLGRCVMVVRSQDNYEGRLPRWLQNFAAKKGAPGYVKLLERAALGVLVADGTISADDAATNWKW